MMHGSSSSESPERGCVPSWHLVFAFLGLVNAGPR
jgi:hypothetical protein